MSSAVPMVDFMPSEKASRVLQAVATMPLSDLEAYVQRNDLSQTPNRALPCATLALCATMHGVEASISLSSVSNRSGYLYAASMYGREVLAIDAMDSFRKRRKEANGVIDRGKGLL